jgi:hypothetical protein
MFNLVYDNRVKAFLIFALLLETLFACTSYSSVFASSFASTVPLGFHEPCNVYEYSGFQNE